VIKKAAVNFGAPENVLRNAHRLKNDLFAPIRLVKNLYSGTTGCRCYWQKRLRVSRPSHAGRHEKYQYFRNSA